MINISIDSREMSRFLKDINNYSETKQAQVKHEVYRATYAIQYSAKETFVPVKKGFLKAGIDAVIRNKSLTGQVIVKRKYGIFVHEGTRPHVIRPKYKKVLAWLPTSFSKTGQKVYSTAGTKKIKIGGLVGKSAIVGKTTTNIKKGQWAHAGEVFHPGTQPNPFLEKAVNRERPIYQSNLIKILSRAK